MCTRAYYLPVSLTFLVNPRLNLSPRGVRGCGFDATPPTTKHNPPTQARMEEQTFIVVAAGGEQGCVNPLVPVRAAFCGCMHAI